MKWLPILWKNILLLKTCKLLLQIKLDRTGCLMSYYQKSIAIPYWGQMISSNSWVSPKNISKIEFVSNSNRSPFIVIFRMLFFKIKRISLPQITHYLILFVVIVRKSFFRRHEDIVIMVNYRGPMSFTTYNYWFVSKTTLIERSWCWMVYWLIQATFIKQRAS
jgi:hypothetical protein